MLEQNPGPNSEDATQIYTGAATEFSVPSKGIATYQYRVKARNAAGDSDWSSPQAVEVRWEKEPNNSYSDAEANRGGPLVTGKKYYGYQDDQKDYFYFDMTASGRIVVDLENYSGRGVQLQLFKGIPSADTRIAWRGDPPYHLEYPHGVPGRYYIYIFTESVTASNSPYILTANFP